MPIARKRATPPAGETQETKPAPDKQAKAAPGGADREGLATALARLKPALRGGAAIPELGHIWFEDGWAMAYDGGLGIRIALDLGLECGVPGSPLIALLGTSSLKEVGLEAGADVLTVKLGRSKTKLKALPRARNPWAFPDKHSQKATLSEAAIEALRSVLIVKPAKPTRLEHQGVAAYGSKEGVDFYATDSKTLALAMLDEAKTGLPPFLFLPRPFAEQVVALCPHGADLYVADDHLAAMGRGVQVYSNVLDTQGIEDLPAMVERTHQPHPDAVPLPAGLEAALNRADVLAGSDEAVIDLTVQGKKLRAAGKYQYGELSEDLVLEEPPAKDVGFSATVSVLRRGLLAADAVSITPASLAFYRENNFLYLVASRLPAR